MQTILEFFGGLWTSLARVKANADNLADTLGEADAAFRAGLGLPARVVANELPEPDEAAEPDDKGGKRGRKGVRA